MGDTGIALSPDGVSLLFCDSANRLSVWDLATGTKRRGPFAATPDAYDFSPDWRTFAFAKRNGPELVDLSTGTVTDLSIAKAWSPRYVRFSPDGTCLWVSERLPEYDKDRRRGWMLDLATGRVRFEKRGRFVPAAFRPDGKAVLLASTAESAGSTAEIVDTTTGEILRTIDMEDSGIHSVYRVAWSPSQSRIAAFGKGRNTWQLRTSAYDLDQGKWCWRDVLPGNRLGVEHNRLAFSPDGRCVLVEGKAGKRIGRVLDAESGKLLLDKEKDCVLAFSPDGKFLATGEERRRVELYDTSTWELVKSFDAGEEGCGSLAFSRDGRTLAVGFSLPSTRELKTAGTVKLLEVSSGDLIAQVTETARARARLAFAGPGRLVCAANDATLRIFELDNPSRPTSFVVPDEVAPCLAVSADGSKVAVGGRSGAIYVRELPTGRLIARLADPGRSTHYLAFLDDRETLMSADREKVSFWHLASGERTRRFQPHDRGIHAIGISESASLLVSDGLGPVSSEFAAFRLPDMSPVFSQDKVASMSDIAFDPTGRWMATGGQRSEEIALRDVASGATVRSFPGRRTFAGGLAFSPDGNHLVIGPTSLKSHPAAIYDVKSGQLLRQLSGPEVGVVSLAVSPDQRLVAVCDVMGTIHVCDFSTGDVLHELNLGPVVARP